MQDKRWLRYQQTASEATLLAARLPKQIRMQLLQIERPVDTPAQATNLEVLVVEDDEVYGAALRDLLRCNGCEITWVRDSVTCLAEVNKRKRPFDLITIDWGLPDLKGHELMQLLQQGGCPSRLALLLNPEPLRDHPRIWDVLGNSGVDVFSKEDGDGCKIGLISVLRELRPDGFCSETPRRRYFPDITALSPKQSPSPLVVERSLLLPGQLESLQVLLTRLQRDTRATTVILLRLDLGRRRFLAEGYAGKPLPLEQAQPDLIYSPLADVLQMSQEVCERVASDSPRFRRLLDILPFQGFLGIPLPEVESPHRSGLFLIKEHGSFGLLDREQARAAAYLIEAWS
jgi:CheY-like chemotaxis protein